MNILLCDDEKDILDVLKLQLEAGGHRCVLTTSGLEAFKMAATQSFDVVILDLHMPEFNGFDVATNLVILKHPPRVFVLTSHQSGELVDKVRQMQHVELLFKPLSREQLFKALANQLN